MTAFGQVSAPPALELHGLQAEYRVRGEWRQVLRGVTLRVEEGASYGLVGESGCGKSTLALAAVGYLPTNGRVSGGSIEVAGRDLQGMSREDKRRTRASSVSMVYQSPYTALNPTMRIGDQLTEAFTVAGAAPSEARERACDLLGEVQISDPARVMERYAHQLSGGMQQRVVIAMALAKDPALLILDEPTTGLDATVEAEVLDLVTRLRNQHGTSVLFITHSLDVVSRTCDRVGVLYAGRLVEEGPVESMFADPRHPYTVGLLRAVPRGGLRKQAGRLDKIPGAPPPLGAELSGCVFADRCRLVEDRCRREEPELVSLGEARLSRCHRWEVADTLPRAEADVGTPSPIQPDAAPILRATEVRKTYRQDGKDMSVLDGVSLALRPGETLGLVGESGSGKSTLARALVGLTEADAGSVIELDGRPLGGRLAGRTRDQVRALQLVFQHPDSALNRRASVRRILGRAVAKLRGGRRSEVESKVQELMAAVCLDAGLADARPAQLSGGLKQRVAIARAFAGNPKVVVCDEPTSALDVSVQATILNLLADLQESEQVAYLFISHDLAVVRYLSDRIAVLYFGRVMELGDSEDIFHDPRHPYTSVLLSTVPGLNGDEPSRTRLEGELPTHADPPTGCVFHARCPRYLGDICRTQEPPLEEIEPGRFSRCHATGGRATEAQKA